ncbi:MAG: hypothetical protein HUK20_06725 [Fibrobacter sp.]|nr:hypothetical protein [Fibrobacter sp.]
MLLRKLSRTTLLGLVSPLLCHAYFTQGDAGQEVFSFMSTFDSPRNIALEKSAGAAPSSDPTISQLNPAALMMMPGKDHVLSLHWQTGDMAENQGSFFYTGHIDKYILQISYNWQDVGAIDGYTEDNIPTNKEYNPFSQLATATFAFPLKHFQFGATLKFASDKLANDAGDRTAFGAAFDWGLAWQSETNQVGLALMARDFGCILRDYTDDNDDAYFPMGQTFAIAGFFKPGTIRRLTLFADSDFPRFQEPFLNLGGEYAINESFSVRVGFSRTWLDLYRDALELLASEDRPDEVNRAHMVSAGLGYSSNLFALDYGFSYLAQGLGMEHRIGLRFGF